MSRIRTIFILVAVLAIGSQAYAAGPFGITGFGVYGSISGNTTGATGTGGIGLTLKWGSFPVIGLQYMLAQSAFSLGMSVDYYIIDSQGLVDALSYFLGAGVYGGFASAGGTSTFDFGLRIPIGLQVWPIRKFEIFLSGIPMITLLPTTQLGFGAELGFRVYL